MFNKFKDLLKSVSEESERLFSRVVDKTLFRQVVSAAFLIARADGDFDSDEKKALAKVISEKMPQFSIQDILKALEECEKKVEFSEDMGVMEIMDDICSASKENAEMIMRISCFIGAADGDFDADEKKVAKSMACGMGINPQKYGL